MPPGAGVQIPAEPIVQKCTAKKVLDGNAVQLTWIYSDCTSSPGQSGSANLVRINGRLFLRAIFEAGGKAKLDHQPYNLSTGSMAKSMGVDTVVVDDIVKMDGGTVIDEKQK